MTAVAPLPPRIPARARPFDKAKVKTAAWQKLLLGRDLSPSREEYDNVIAALWEGDTAMDALVNWMYEFGAGPSRQLFQQAVTQGIDSIPDAPQPLKDFFAVVDAQPVWLDRALLEEGVSFIHGIGLAGPYVLRDLALMGGYLLSGFNQVLVMTGALNKDTALRIAETGQWWVDCTEHGGLERFGPGFRSTLHVRLVHAMVRRALAKHPKWDENQWGVPVNQIDMVATYLGFCVVMLGGLRQLGIPVTARESKAVMHLWAYAGWLMGVDERFLVFSEKDGIILLSHTFMTQSRPDWTSQELARALAQEPLKRKYPNLPGLRRKLAYHQHLSVSRFFLGKKKMRQLGLPDDILPWYPVLSAAPRLVNYLGHRLVPPLYKRAQQQGRAAQLDVLRQMFGDHAQAVGVQRDRSVAQH